MKKLILMMLLVLVLPIGMAQTLDELETTFYIQEGTTFVRQKFMIQSSENTYLELPITDDANNITLLVSDRPSDYTLVTQNGVSKVRVRITALTESVELSYRTGELTYRGDYFIVNLIPPYLTNRLETTVVLPEGATLARPTQQMTSSIYPNGMISTDGQHIIVKWVDEDIQSKETPTYFVIYQRPTRATFPAMTFLMVAGILVLITLLVYNVLNKHRKPDTKIVREKELIVPGLKEKEKKVVDALKLKGGRTTQATLRVVTEMPKSTLSGVLKELEERSVIYKEKKGKTNLIVLKEDERNDMERIRAENEGE